MKTEGEWETSSLEWIHRVREEMDKQIKERGSTPARWIKERGEVDIKRLCEKLGLRNVTIIQPKVKV